MNKVDDTDIKQLIFQALLADNIYYNYTYYFVRQCHTLHPRSHHHSHKNSHLSCQCMYHEHKELE